MVARGHLGPRLVLKERERYALGGPREHFRERTECESWTAAVRHAGELPSECPEILPAPAAVRPAVAGEWTMWEAAVNSNFIFLSREIKLISCSAIALILFHVYILYLHIRNQVHSLCVLPLNHGNLCRQSLN